MLEDTAALASDRSMPVARMRSSSVSVAHDAPSAVPPNCVWEALTVLIEALNCVVVDDGADARQYVLSAFDLLRHPTGQRSSASSPPQLTAPPPRWRGGLAGWQARRLSMHIDQHLSETLLCKDLASLVNLSISHFIRAFRVSFGCSPHAYVTRRRIELAQGLMLATDAPLGQIALECGLADQAHLSRLFKHVVGDSPAAWRRARSQPSGMPDGFKLAQGFGNVARYAMGAGGPPSAED